MPKGYKLNPNMQMKIEDERAGRLDHVYETELSLDEVMKRIGKPVSSKLSSYETVTENGILYILFNDDAEANNALHSSRPLKYAVRFESEGKTTVIRVRFIWDENSNSVPYLLKQDIDDFFRELFDAVVSERDNTVWTDGTGEFVKNDPLKLHGRKVFWICSGIFIVLWVLLFFAMNIR